MMYHKFCKQKTNTELESRTYSKPFINAHYQKII